MKSFLSETLNPDQDDDNVSGGQDVRVFRPPGAASLRGWGPGQGGHSVGQVWRGGQEGGGGHLLGMRGLAQVKSYEGMTTKAKADFDCDYAKSVSFFTDVKIILSTFLYFLKRPPTY